MNWATTIGVGGSGVALGAVSVGIGGGEATAVCIGVGDGVLDGVTVGASGVFIGVCVGTGVDFGEGRRN